MEITYDLENSKIKYIFNDDNGKEEYYLDGVLMNVNYLNISMDKYIKEMEQGLEIVKLTMKIENIRIERK